MYDIANFINVDFDGTYSKVCEIICNNESDLPDKKQCIDRYISPGSVSIVCNKNFYILDFYYNWVSLNYNNLSIIEYIGNVPTLINSVYDYLVSYTIEGNANGVGDRSDNLFTDKTIYNNTITEDLRWFSSATSSSVIISVEPNTKYYINTDTILPIFRIAESEEIPNTSTIFTNAYRLTNINSLEITTGDNTHYLVFQGSQSLTNLWLNELTVDKGYKIIITSKYDNQIIENYIYTSNPLLENEFIYSDGYIIRSDSTIEYIDTPVLNILKGESIIDFETAVKPDNFSFKYYSYILNNNLRMAGRIMYIVIDSRNINYVNGVYTRQCDIVCNSISDLPNKTEIDTKNIGYGSIAWCITEKIYKILNKVGEWV